MEIERLKQSYKNQLVKAGVDIRRAEQVVRTVTQEELQLILEILPERALVLEKKES
ncbi:MAG: hypothetical protein JOZ78_01580 [Chroococcidiopsidaceae cyanobacterium CP_BM_ER_R8_30]|nr:hypothetical protein [Chroococcidiopsidaceae cyanobacterium CP_BM_ER_R8_30]